MLKPEEFKAKLMESLTMSVDAAALSKHYDESILQFNLLKNQFELSQSKQNELIGENDELRRSNGDLLMKVGIKQPNSEPEEKEYNIKTFLEGIEY